MMTLRTLEVLQTLAVKERSRAIDQWLANPTRIWERQMDNAKLVCSELETEIAMARARKVVAT